MVRITGKIRRLLVDAGLVNEQDWTAAREKGGQPVATLLSQGLLSEDALLETLGQAAGVPPVDLSRIKPDPAALACLSLELDVEDLLARHLPEQVVDRLVLGVEGRVARLADR